MSFFTAVDKADFLQQLHVVWQPHVDERWRDQVQMFAGQFFHMVPLDELMEKRLTDLAGCMLSAWFLLGSFVPEKPVIRVFIPDYEKNGWQSSHMAVQVLHPDLPFLVDSVRTELNRRGLNIHTLQSCVLSTKRAAGGKLQVIASQGLTDPGFAQESLMYFEVVRCGDTKEQAALAQAITEILGDVRLVASDYEPMKTRARQMMEALDKTGHELVPEDLHEARQFFRWLLDDNFTFLGYEEFSVQHAHSAKALIRYDEASLLGLSRRLRQDLSADALKIPPLTAEHLLQPQLLSFAKASSPGWVHRPAYPDFVSVRMVNTQGRVIKECRFMGLYTTTVYNNATLNDIPVIRRKVDEVIRRSGFSLRGHLGKELLRVLEALPRDELFQTTLDQLTETALSVVQIQERSKIRLLLRRDPFGYLVYALFYVPRDIYSTEIRQKVQQVLVERLQATDSQFLTFFSESVLTRVQFILRVDPFKPVDFDPRRLEQEVIQVCRSWQDDYACLLREQFGEAGSVSLQADFPRGFPAGYRERFSAESAALDMRHVLALNADTPLIMHFYQPLTADTRALNCKLYHADTPLALSDILPILENLGLRVLEGFPFVIEHRDGRLFWIHDLLFSAPESVQTDIQQLNDFVQDAFIAVVSGQAENDAFNRLVLNVGMPWRDVVLLRAYAHYLKQIRLGFDSGYIASALLNHADIAHKLVQLFYLRFATDAAYDKERDEKQQKLIQSVLQDLDNVSVLNEDRILRRYLNLIQATLRTNFFQLAADDTRKSYISFKFDPSRVSDLPKPVPKYEIFMYSPRVEGVHLRGGKVARGGLRWSDREEDYRTEVLGLVKAQQVKNAAIVPMGAKGGFVPRRLPVNGSRDDIQAETVACYRLFISSLLDITDNLKDGKVVPPAGVVRHDDDDPYLVVAADKGTATFSDIANSIAGDYGFWLGDAFASGGSAGYDHKKMGITARGAWVSVQRHFRDQGIDVQKDPVTVVGIGDMSGDVFGNGMLRSQSLLLVAAFNHQHIFIDPDPDPQASFTERQRLFNLPRSGWADYDSGLISQGGGVFLRSAKSVPISPQMKARFAIDADRLSPTELVHAILQAPVDLLWNGGIGTYVKASSESHADVGDKANDALRVNGCELRAKVVGEGGNLGMTQLGRVEYALHGGAVNTDFIDNVAGVDCSDHEVNIKILLGDVVSGGDMTEKQRNRLLESMTEEVSGLVLRNNYRQTQVLSLAHQGVVVRIDEFKCLMTDLTIRGKLDRALEFLPPDTVINERIAKGMGLTRPELAVLLSYSKIDLHESLLRSSLPDEAFMAREMTSAFPEILSRDYAPAMQRHRLKREIISSQIANDLVDHMGITHVQRLRDATGLDASLVARAYIAVRDIFHLHYWFREVEALDHRVDSQTQLAMMEELRRLGRKAGRWFLLSRGESLDAKKEIAHFRHRVEMLALKLDHLLEGAAMEQWQSGFEKLIADGVPELLARMIAGVDFLYTLLHIIEAAELTHCDVAEVAHMYFAVGNALDLNDYMQQIQALPANRHEQTLAKEAFTDALDRQQKSIAIAVLQQQAESTQQRLDDWLQSHQSQVARWKTVLAALRGNADKDYAAHVVAGRELASLLQGCS